jgi:hypothetical protein
MIVQREAEIAQPTARGLLLDIKVLRKGFALTLIGITHCFFFYL